MQLINKTIGVPLGYLMFICYELLHNYGLTIILFSVLTKVILFPLSVKVQKNSIKMVKIQPRLDELAIRYADDKEQMYEEYDKVYKEEKYSPFVGLVPTLIQIPIILGLINVIYNPLQHLLHMDSHSIGIILEKAKEISGVDNFGNLGQMKIVELVSDAQHWDSFSQIQGVDGLQEILQKIQSIDMQFMGLDLAAAPSLSSLNSLLLIPVLAGLSAWLLCVIQNKMNVLQQEQSKKSQIGMTLFMILFSLYFTFIVPAGVGVYWICSNLFSIPVLFIVNFLYDPKKYIDYEAKAKMEERIRRQKEREKEKKAESRKYKEKEKADYRRFFKTEDKKLVFYSERNGFYKYFQNVIEELLKTDIVIDYVTSDPKDAVFENKNEKIRSYYIGDKRLIPFMMKMDADIVVMTMPDLDNFQIKRSYVRKDIEYIYMFHAPLSFIMTIRDKALDHYDTVFCTGPHQVKEIRESEKLYHLPEKKIVECGYGVIENMRLHYMEKRDFYDNRNEKTIVIAPSWQYDNILDSCLDEMLEQILNCGWKVIVRPHPEYVKRYGDRMSAIIEKYESRLNDLFVIETDFSSNETIYGADILITDWSWVAYEYSLATYRPSLFINTQMKVANPNWDKLPLTPLNLSLRGEIGIQLEKSEMNKMRESVKQLLSHYADYEKKIEQICKEYIFNMGHSGAVGAQYIIDSLKQREKKDEL